MRLNFMYRPNNRFRLRAGTEKVKWAAESAKKTKEQKALKKWFKCKKFSA